jgi:trehalose 2-sulfotransferase
MTRRDKLRQAISLWRALQTRTWRLEHPGEKLAASGLHYSFDAIDHLRRALANDDECWREYLGRHRREAITISYEDDLERDQQSTIERVLGHVGVKAPHGWRAPVRTYRQADELTEVWVRRYRDDHDARAGESPSSSRAA